jgi:hypothetical protein
MRWDNLFDDLESQLEQGLSAEEIDLQAEEERLRLGRLRLRDRLVSIHEASRADAAGSSSPRRTAPDGSGDLRVILSSGEPILVRPVAFGRDWLSGDLIAESGADVAVTTARQSSAQCVLPFDAIAGIVFSRQQVRMSLAQRKPKAASGPTLSERLGLAFVLRDLCRRRSGVDLVLASASAGSTSLSGTIDRVGHDHFDLAVHDPGTPRRESLVSSIRLVPLSQLLLVRLAG